MHPLLLAIGTERYVPYRDMAPCELLTQANAILGFNQCSLAKFLLIAAKDSGLDCHRVPEFFSYVLERVQWERDLHFQTKTSMDTLDYSGEDLNRGSEVVIAVCGNPIRELTSEVSADLVLPEGFDRPASRFREF